MNGSLASDITMYKLAKKDILAQKLKVAVKKWTAPKHKADISKRCGLVMNDNLQTGRYNIGEELFQIDGRNDQVKVLANVLTCGLFKFKSLVCTQISYKDFLKCILQFATKYFSDEQVSQL